jgi:hypothetical protein
VRAATRCGWCGDRARGLLGRAWRRCPGRSGASNGRRQSDRRAPPRLYPLHARPDGGALRRAAAGEGWWQSVWRTRLGWASDALPPRGRGALGAEREPRLAA